MSPKEEHPHDLHDDEGYRLPIQAKNMIAGGIAGMIAKSVVAPVDRIKIMYQVSSARFRLRDLPSVGYKIVQNEGITALWKGNSATLIRVFPYAGIQFSVFNAMKSSFVGDDQNMDDSTTGVVPNDKKWNLTPMQSLFSGSVAGAISVLCTYPLDLTRAQLAVLKKHDGTRHGFIEVLRMNYKRGGMKGLYRGIEPTLLGMLPYAGVAFAINEQSKRHIHKIYNRDPTVVEKMICGGLAGLVAQSLTYPLEVTRRRMQTIGIISKSTDSAVNVLGAQVETKFAQSAAAIAESHVIKSSIDHNSSMVRVMRQLLLEQGVQGFFKGLTMNWLKGPLSFSISFTTFDLVKDWLEKIDTTNCKY